MAKVTKSMQCLDIAVDDTYVSFWELSLKTSLKLRDDVTRHYCYRPDADITKLTPGICKLILTHCTASKSLTQDPLDEVEVS